MAMLDYLIIGGGLSGIAFAEQLRKQSKSFCLITDDSQQSSKVAGGIFNPVILKRFTLAWKADKQLKEAMLFYQAIEEILGKSLLKFMPIYRRFNSVEEQNDWFASADKPLLSSFLSTDLMKDIPGIHSEFSFGEVEQTGVLDTKRLLKAYRAFLQANDLLLVDTFDHQQMRIEEDVVYYKDKVAKRIVFCEGYGLVQNPFFRDLPLKGNKGEYLIIKSQELKLTAMIKSSVFIIPLGHDLYKIGATYERKFENQKPSEEKKTYLQQKLDKVLDCSYEIIDQQAGVRPTVPDRRPLIGQHPTHKQLFICNGFGSRGVLIAPSASEMLFNYIEHKTPLDAAVDCKRYFN